MLTHAQVGSWDGAITILPESQGGPVDHIITHQHGVASGFEMCFLLFLSDPRTVSAGVYQLKHVSKPDSEIKKFKPHLIYAVFSGR